MTKNFDRYTEWTLVSYWYMLHTPSQILEVEITPLYCSLMSEDMWFSSEDKNILLILSDDITVSSLFEDFRCDHLPVEQ